MSEEADAELMELAGLAQMQQPQAERGISVNFLVEPQENAAKSKEAGRPIHDEVEVCEIRIVGDPDVRRHVVTEEHKRRFPKQYIAFKKRLDQDVASGTPLSAWPVLSRALVEDARFFGVRTVEQLADIPDSNLKNLGPGWMGLRQKARDWLIAAKDGAILVKLRSELEERDARIDALEEMLRKQAAALHAEGKVPLAEAPAQSHDLDALKASVAALAAQLASQAAPKRRGRPPKVKNGVEVAKE